MSNFPARGRILVVEDDAAIAEELVDALRHMRFEVAGPFSTADEALAAIGSLHLDAAILDVRLENSLSFPVAHRLRDMNVPFMFMTGSVDDVDAAFAFEPVLIKPVRLSVLFGTLDRILLKQAA